MTDALNEKIMIPVVMPGGSTEFMQLAVDETPTYLIVVHQDKARLLATSDPNEDRIHVGAVTLAEAVGKVLMANPRLSYDDILDHMEV